MRDPACNRGLASIGTSESDPGLYVGPGVYPGPGFYPKFYGIKHVQKLQMPFSSVTIIIIISALTLLAAQFPLWYSP